MKYPKKKKKKIEVLARFRPIMVENSKIELDQNWPSTAEPDQSLVVCDSGKLGN